ncbi:MAG TPA: hydrolase 2, exosortase A system-associated, partial [Gammaproteobacteria bacterium]|nr:hydrolase 2, exosortase A system-associated [Gammaproteobacteria bacterium]
KRGAVLFVPSFAEEMNKSRRQLALQARSLAAAGYAVLLVDLFGTGDSEGNFGDARWETWLGDLAAAVQWLATRGHARIVVCALRFGALLARELVGQVGERVERLVLWQPVTSGRQYMEQFLRLRVAAAMVGGAPAVTVRDLRDTLARGAAVEVAGYELHPELVGAVDRSELTSYPPSSRVPIHWLELASEPGRGIGAGSQRVLAAWRERGATVAVDEVIGPQFWSTVEIAVAPALIETTTRCVAGPT